MEAGRTVTRGIDSAPIPCYPGWTRLEMFLSLSSTRMPMSMEAMLMRGPGMRAFAGGWVSSRF